MYYHSNADGYKTSLVTGISVPFQWMLIPFLEYESNSNSNINKLTFLGFGEILCGSKFIWDYKLTMYTSHFV